MKENTRLWLALLMFGLFGQLAWTIENMYFNVFVYNTLISDVSIIAWMVALSAVTATITTLLIGALSDKLGKRRVFITVGYILWGISVILFAFLSRDNVGKLFSNGNVGLISGILAIFMDCLMTFFGSSANDACFNAWITDNVDNSQRAKFETVLATLPLISMLIVFGLLDGLTQAGKWSTFYFIIGSLVSVGGIVGIFFIKDKKLKPSNKPLFENIKYGFRKDVIKNNKELYLSLITLLVFSISTQIFMPYMIIYIQLYLGISNYALILGVVLIVSSIISIVVGRIIDLIGTKKFYLPAIILYSLGLLLMYKARSNISVILVGIIMMSGNLIVTSLINGSIRNYTPKENAGGFQGIRMIFAVMLPMIIGPFIGAAVIKNSQTYYIDLGTFKQVPNENIWLASAIVALLIIIPYIFLNKIEKENRNKHNDLLTTYGQQLNVNDVLSEYPRKHLVRDSYIKLNGYWNYKISNTKKLDGKYDGRIVVPYPVESLLSQVEKTIKPNQYLIYQKEFDLPYDFNKGLVFLHFQAVDQICEVYLNKQLVGKHIGGYLPFKFDITNYLLPNNEIVVIVSDNSDKSYLARGKQTNNRGGIWYSNVTGIWQTVWLESTVKNYIEDIYCQCDYDSKTLNLTIDGNSDSYQVIIKEAEKIVYSDTVGKNATIKFDNIHPWSVDDPFLYDIYINNFEDFISSYFAFRKVSIYTDKDNHKLIALNNKPIFNKGVLDQGYYSDGIFTPASYQQIEDDIIMLKEMGFNTIRKHIKIEPEIFYYLCDKHGILLWQDMVSGGGKYSFLVTSALPFIGINLKDNHYGLFARAKKQSREDYYQQLNETITYLKRYPSIIIWVPFNEGWGQFDAKDVTAKIKQLDNTRLIDSTSGWHDQKCGDFYSKHIYFGNIAKGFANADERIQVLSEYGGYNYLEENHVYNNANYGYQTYHNKKDLMQAYKDLHENQIIPLIESGLAATIYTQLSDVEDEVNGLVTYDRKVVKFDKDKLRKINKKLNDSVN